MVGHWVTVVCGARMRESEPPLLVGWVHPCVVLGLHYVRFISLVLLRNIVQTAEPQAKRIIIISG